MCHVSTLSDDRLGSRIPTTAFLHASWYTLNEVEFDLRFYLGQGKALFVTHLSQHLMPDFNVACPLL